MLGAIFSQTHLVTLPTIVNYNASAVKIHNAARSLFSAF
jgi:hypothetical protein